MTEFQQEPSTPEESMTEEDVLTPRLRLVAITPALLRVEGSALAAAVRAEIPAMWPPEHWEPHVYDFLEELYARTAYAVAWTRYVVTRSEPATLIGTLGGFPRTETEAEVGYEILPPWQRQGLATEGLLALMEEIRRRKEIRTFTAQTYPHLIASVRVMEKCGFMPAGAGDEEGTVRYRRER
jgi:RimJ/RimL family protein N-acetyltransferase